MNPLGAPPPPSEASSPEAPRPRESDASFLRSARVVSLLTALSRVLGMVRDMVMASLLGNGLVADAFNYAWRIPNLFRRLFGEGALGTAFVPVFGRVLEEDGPERARDVANRVISTLAAALLALVAALILLLALVPDESLAAAIGMSVPKATATRELLQLLLPYLAVICVIAQFMAVMHSLGSFAVPAFSPVILNLVWIFGALAAPSIAPDDERSQAIVIAGTILAASALQFVWHLPKLAALGMRFVPRRPAITVELRQVLEALGPMLLGMGAAQVNVLVDSTIALSVLGDGGVTHLYYATRVMQFPLGIVAIALTTAVYPLLTRLAARGDREASASTLALALRTQLLLVLPAATGLAVLSAPIVRLLFEHGEFGADATAHTATALRGYALGIPFAGLVILITRAYYALGDRITPVRVGLSLVLVNALLDLLLVGPLEELGLSLATTLVSALTAGLLLVGLARPLAVGTPLALLRGTSRVLVAAGVMGVVVHFVDVVLAERLGAGLGAELTRVTVDITLGVAAFALAARLLCWSLVLEVRGLLRDRGT